MELAVKLLNLIFLVGFICLSMIGCKANPIEPTPPIRQEIKDKKKVDNKKDIKKLGHIAGNWLRKSLICQNGSKPDTYLNSFSLNVDDSENTGFISLQYGTGSKPTVIVPVDISVNSEQKLKIQSGTGPVSCTYINSSNDLVPCHFAMDIPNFDVTISAEKIGESLLIFREIDKEFLCNDTAGIAVFERE
jgi:hypothetical protein